jgi:tRNA-2-methylthio-N6-dimethylallyladenosine synthase
METYGCQMNVNDSEIVLSILQSNGYQVSSEVETVSTYSTISSKRAQADVILLNTCAIREKAENKIWDRLGYFKNLKKKEGRDITVGVLG